MLLLAGKGNSISSICACPLLWRQLELKYQNSTYFSHAGHRDCPEPCPEPSLQMQEPNQSVPVQHRTWVPLEGQGKVIGSFKHTWLQRDGMEENHGGLALCWGLLLQNKCHFLFSWAGFCSKLSDKLLSCHRMEISLSLLPHRMRLPQAERGFPSRHTFPLNTPHLFSQRNLGNRLSWWRSHRSGA